MHVHPLSVPDVKRPAPWLVRRELLTNQVAEPERSWNVLIPFELNCPWAKNAKFFVLSGISAVVSCVHGAPVDGASAQTRITIKVTGVAVGIGVELLELPPQLSSNVAITKASTGATIKHLLCHIKHSPMPWRLRRCQAERAKTKRARPEEFARRESRGKGGNRFEIDLWSRSNKRTAGIEGGGRLPDARLFSARLAADVIRLPGGVCNRSAVQ